MPTRTWSVASPASSPPRSPVRLHLRRRAPISLLTAAGELEAWRGSPVPAVCLVVVLDQFSRHVYRRRGEQHLQPAADARALAVAEELLARGWQDRLSAPELVFSLLPLRHSPTLDRLQRVLAQARIGAAVAWAS